MTKQEDYFIRLQIKRLNERKEKLVDEFIGACEEINREIKYYKKKIRAGGE